MMRVWYLGDVSPSADATKVSKSCDTHAFIPSVMSQEVVISEDSDWLSNRTSHHLVTIAKVIQVQKVHSYSFDFGLSTWLELSGSL